MRTAHAFRLQLFPDHPSRRFLAGPRKRRKATPIEAAEEVATNVASPTVRRPTRKRTALELLPEEQIPLDDDGEPMELNPDSVTMAELCMDMGVGRPSTRTEESVIKAVEWKQKQRLVRQQARERQKERVRLSRKTDESVEQPLSNDADGAVNAGGGEREGSQAAPEDEVSVSAATERLQAAESSNDVVAQAQTEQAADADVIIGSLRTNRYAAQVRLDENGDIIMDDLSLTVDRHEAARAEAGGVEYELVEEAEKDRFVNSLTWSKKLTGQRWSREETDLFYHVRRLPSLPNAHILTRNRMRRAVHRHVGHRFRDDLSLDAWSDTSGDKEQIQLRREEESYQTRYSVLK